MKTVPLVLILSILATAAFLRMYEIDRHALWIDEANSVLIADRDLPGVIEGLRNDANPPVYYLLLHFWIDVFGDGERAVRALSIVCGLALVAALFLVGSRLGGARAGLFAGAVGALHPLQIYHSQTARMYTLLPLLAVLSFLFLSRALVRGRPADWVGYVIATALAPLTHNWGLFLLPAGWAMLLLQTRMRSQRAFVVAQIAAAVPYLIWLPVILRQTEFARTNWIARVLEGIPPILRIPMSFDSYFVGGGIPAYFSYFEIGTHALQVQVARVFFAVLLILAVRGVLRSLRNPEEREGGRSKAVTHALLLSYLLVPLGAGFAVSLFVPMYLPGRYDVVAFPAFALLAGLGFAHVRPAALRVAALALLVALAASAAVPYYRAEPRRGDLEAARYLAEHAGPRDLVVFAGPRRSTVEYSLRRLGADLVLESFPRELAHHMGLYEPASLLEDPARLDRDAARIVARADSLARLPAPTGPASTVLWVVDYPAAPVNAHLYRKLARFEPARDRIREDLRIYCFRVTP